MKRIRLSFFIFCILIFCISTTQAAPLGDMHINQVVKSLKTGPKLLIKQYLRNTEWSWLEMDYFDEQYPLTIDVLCNNTTPPARVAYLVAPSGYNFRCNYFTPTSQNIAHFMRKNGYLVVGITFREDHLPLEQNDQSLLAWGLAKHRLDMHKIISTVQAVIGLPYELLGQSSAAVCILDYAAHYSDPLFQKIVLLDTDSFDPALQPEKVTYANMTYDALGQLIDQGVYVSSFGKSFKDLIFAASLNPDADSGQARPYNLPGNFTLDGLLHFSLIYTAYLPGLHTPLTGLPGEWVMMQGVAAGYYNFSPDPATDDFGLLQTDIQVLPLFASEIGEGTSPIALERDIYGILALNNAYSIDWAGIREKVVMINGEFSSGNQTYYGTQIRNAGNSNVVINVIPGFGYADLLFGTNAEQAVWTHILD